MRIRNQRFVVFDMRVQAEFLEQSQTILGHRCVGSRAGVMRHLGHALEICLLREPAAASRWPSVRARVRRPTHFEGNRESAPARRGAPPKQVERRRVFMCFWTRSWCCFRISGNSQNPAALLRESLGNVAMTCSSGIEDRIVRQWLTVSKRFSSSLLVFLGRLIGAVGVQIHQHESLSSGSNIGARKHVGLHPVAVGAGVPGEIDEDQLVLLRAPWPALRDTDSSATPGRMPRRLRPKANVFACTGMNASMSAERDPNSPGSRLMEKIRNTARGQHSRDAQAGLPA